MHFLVDNSSDGIDHFFSLISSNCYFFGLFVMG